MALMKLTMTAFSFIIDITMVTIVMKILRTLVMIVILTHLRMMTGLPMVWRTPSW